MEFGDSEILHVARLARLRLVSSEVEPLREDLNRVLAYVSQLQTLDLKGVEPTRHVVEMGTLLRDDVVEPSLGVKDALHNAPEVQHNMFVVPRIMEEANGDE